MCEVFRVSTYSCHKVDVNFQSITGLSDMVDLRLILKRSKISSDFSEQNVDFNTWQQLCTFNILKVYQAIFVKTK